MNIRDAYEDGRFNRAVDKATGYRTRTILCAPVWSLDNEVIGVIQVINKRGGEFGRDDESLFRAFAHQAAVAVENFNLYRRMLLSHKKMAILLDVASSVSGTLDLGELITQIVERIAEALQCERSSYFVYDRDVHELWSMEAHGSELKEIRFPATAGLAGACATTAQVVRISDAYDDERFNPAFDIQSGYRTRTVMCMPVHNREGAITGVVQVINRLEGRFDDDDEELLKAIAAQIGVAVDNARLHADTLGMRRYLESVQESISNGIVTCDKRWTIVTANTAAAGTLGRPEAALLGIDIREAVAGNDALLALMQKVYDTGSGVAEYDMPFWGGTGQEGSANVNVMPLNDADGESQGLVMVLEDITSEKRVKNTLTRYMAKDIVERMLQDPEQQNLGGVRGNATVLFSDIRDFTTIAENLTAEATMDLLNEYFGRMVEEVFAERGVLDKFMGDALMAVYGIPFSQDDDAVRAVRTALNMGYALQGLNLKRAHATLPAIRIGIGINTDEVLSGNMGSSKRTDYTVIGDGVNVSSRLESLNKHYGTGILLSQSTRAQLGDAFFLRPIDTVVTKGKSLPVEIFEALGGPDYQPTPGQEGYGEGLAAYRAGAFGDAARIFERGAEEDPPSRTMAARCRAYIADPPGSSWDGVWRALEK